MSQNEKSRSARAGAWSGEVENLTGQSSTLLADREGAPSGGSPAGGSLPRPEAAGGPGGGESPGGNPGLVSPGSEIEKPHLQSNNAGSDNLLGIDWLSITASAEGWVQQVKVSLQGLDSGPTRDVKPRQGFRRGLAYPSGVTLYEGHSSGRAWLLVPGSACSQLGGAKLYRLGRVAMFGGTCKRLDIRQDMHGEGITLIDDLVDACERGQLCHVRQYGPMPIKGTDGSLIGNGVYLGSQFSARFIRAYDKGLEQGTLGAGQWVRYEAQLRDDYAHEAACAVFSATEDDWPLEAFRRLVGVVDFRQGVRPGYSLDEFPRPDFWREFVGQVNAIRAQLEPVDSDAGRWISAARSQYGGVLRLAAERAGVTVEQAASVVFGGAFISAGTRQNPVVDKLAAVLSDFFA